VALGFGCGARLVIAAAFRLLDLGLIGGLRLLQARGSLRQRLLALRVLVGLLLRDLGVLLRDLGFALGAFLGELLGLAAIFVSLLARGFLVAARTGLGLGGLALLLAGALDRALDGLRVRFRGRGLRRGGRLRRRRLGRRGRRLRLSRRPRPELCRSATSQ